MFMKNAKLVTAFTQKRETADDKSWIFAVCGKKVVLYILSIRGVADIKTTTTKKIYQDPHKDNSHSTYIHCMEAP